MSRNQRKDFHFFWFLLQNYNKKSDERQNFMLIFFNIYCRFLKIMLKNVKIKYSSGF